MNHTASQDRVRPVKVDFARRLHSWLKKMPSPEDALGDHESIPQLVHRVFQDARDERATDVHIDPENGTLCIRFRIDGILRDVALIPREHGAQFLGHIKALVDLDPTPLLRPASGGTLYDLDNAEVNLRVTCTPTVRGEKMSVRLLDPRRVRYTLEELGLNHEQKEKIDRWLEGMNGMVLVTGATGSGKTTSLYALLHQLKSLNCSVVTIEDPVEYHVEGINQIQVNEARGVSFSEGVKTMLRLDPDFLMVGEMRDRASAEAALAASSTGRVLLSSLHSRDAAGAITTLRNLDVQDFEITAALELVISQRLVRRLCPDCKREEEPPSEDRGWLEALGVAVPPTSWVGTGCEKCRHTGYRRRIGVFEVWHVDEDANELIRRHTDEKSLRRAIRESGTETLLEDGMRKAAEGITSLAELRRVGSYGFGIAHR